MLTGHKLSNDRTNQRCRGHPSFQSMQTDTPYSRHTVFWIFIPQQPQHEIDHEQVVL